MRRAVLCLHQALPLAASAMLPMLPMLPMPSTPCMHACRCAPTPSRTSAFWMRSRRMSASEEVLSPCRPLPPPCFGCFACFGCFTGLPSFSPCCPACCSALRRSGAEAAAAAGVGAMQRQCWHPRGGPPQPTQSTSSHCRQDCPTVYRSPHSLCGAGQGAQPLRRRQAERASRHCRHPRQAPGAAAQHAVAVMCSVQVGLRHAVHNSAAAGSAGSEWRHAGRPPRGSWEC